MAYNDSGVFWALRCAGGWFMRSYAGQPFINHSRHLRLVLVVCKACTGLQTEDMIRQPANN
jgi:hypothetical protein